LEILNKFLSYKFIKVYFIENSFELVFKGLISIYNLENVDNKVLADIKNIYK